MLTDKVLDWRGQLRRARQALFAKRLEWRMSPASWWRRALCWAAGHRWEYVWGVVGEVAPRGRWCLRCKRVEPEEED